MTATTNHLNGAEEAFAVAAAKLEDLIHRHGELRDSSDFSERATAAHVLTLTSLMHWKHGPCPYSLLRLRALAAATSTDELIESGVSIHILGESRSSYVGRRELRFMLSLQSSCLRRPLTGSLAMRP